MRLPLKLRPWFLALLEEEREKARVQEKNGILKKAFQRKVNPIAKMFALLTIAKRDATGRPAPTRTCARRVHTQGRKGGSDSTLEFCGFLVLLFGNHARVLGLGLVESIVVSE